jgi:predicted nucleic acid-binding protein
VTVPVGSGQLYSIDTSAHARVNNPAVRKVIAGPITDRAAATCVTVDLEAGYSGRNVDDVRSIAERRHGLYVVLPISEAIAERARDVQVRMAARGDHRAAGVIDLLTAAVAEHHGAVVLHYDADFEHVAAITGQPHAWIIPRGTVKLTSTPTSGIFGTTPLFEGHGFHPPRRCPNPRTGRGRDLTSGDYSVRHRTGRTATIGN